MQSIDPSTYGEEQEAGTRQKHLQTQEGVFDFKARWGLLSLSSENSYEQSLYLGL